MGWIRSVRNGRMRGKGRSDRSDFGGEAQGGELGADLGLVAGVHHQHQGDVAPFLGAQVTLPLARCKGIEYNVIEKKSERWNPALEVARYVRGDLEAEQKRDSGM